MFELPKEKKTYKNFPRLNIRKRKHKNIQNKKIVLILSYNVLKNVVITFKMHNAYYNLHLSAALI